MTISASNVAWLADELEQQLCAGYKWCVLEYHALSGKFEYVHLYYDDDIAEKYCKSIREKDIVVRLVETATLQQLMERLSSSQKLKNDIDYYEIDLSSFSVSTVLKVNPDQNPLHNPDGNEFTEELINHFETKSSDNKIDRPTLLYPFIETDLMNFPIIELDNWGTRNSLVRALGEEHLRMVTFEKTFVPAELIEEYVIVDQKPLDTIYSPEQINVVNSFKTLEEAQQCFNSLAEKVVKPGDISCQLLVGRYHNQKVEFNAEGDVQHHTGLVIDIDVAGIPSLSKDGSKYPVNPNESMTVREHMYGRYDAASTAMVYYDFSTLKMKIPDKEFWNRESVSLKKKQNEGKSLEGDEKSLLSKARENNGKGMKR